MRYYCGRCVKGLPNKKIWVGRLCFEESIRVFCKETLAQHEFKMVEIGQECVNRILKDPRVVKEEITKEQYDSGDALESAIQKVQSVSTDEIEQVMRAPQVVKLKKEEITETLGGVELKTTVEVMQSALPDEIGKSIEPELAKAKAKTRHRGRPRKGK